MTPQADFCVLASIAAGQIEPLRAALARCCEPLRPGHADPAQHLKLAQIPTLHNIRAVIMEDPSLGDRAVHPVVWPDEPVYLAILGCCDGPAEALLRDLAAHSGDWLRVLLAYCEGFAPDTDLVSWLIAHQRGSAASYVNGPGRTVAQVHEEAALAALLKAGCAGLASAPVRARAAQLRALVAAQRPTLCTIAPTPPDVAIRTLFKHLGVPAALLVFVAVLPALWWLLLPALAIAAWIIRHHEKTDPLVVVLPDPADIAERSRYEDHDCTNPFTAIGSVKPGWLRLAVVRLVLWVIDWGAFTLFRSNRLGRVGTIHFARWVLIDQGRRVIFTSEYDGFAEAYMDDFINKVSFGLNASFTNGIGYPRTRWLAFEGSTDEQRFKYFMRHHQIVTQFWWRAYPGLTTFELARHSRMRHGYENQLSDVEAARWLSECAQ